MSDNSDVGCYCLCFLIIFIIPMIVLLSLYSGARHPGLSIVDFSVPALNKTSNETIGDIYFDLKLRNKNKAISLYYVDPFNIAISYYPIEDPYQKYVWEYTLPPFSQGNGNTKHIRGLIGQPSKVVHNQENHNVTGKVVTFSIDLIVSYKYNYWVKGGVNKIETGGEVVIDANTGERVSKDRIKLKRVASKEAGGTTLQLLGGAEAGDGGSEGKRKKSDGSTSGSHMNVPVFTFLPMMYLILFYF